MPTNFTGNPASVDSPSPAPNLSGNYPVATLPADGDAINAASVAQEARLGPNWLAYALERFRDMKFGTGVDGAFVQNNGISNSSIPSMSMYSTVSILLGGVNTNGWPIIARTSITINGGTGGTTARVSGFGPGGGVVNTGGPHFSTFSANGATNSTMTYPQALSCYGLGGNGGNGGGATAGIGSVVSPGSSYKQYPYRFHSGPPIGQSVYTPGSGAVAGSTTYDAIKGGAAGTNGDYMAGTTTPGLGGAGGALVVLISPIINIGPVAAFYANGGNGSTGTGTNVNGGGGGGGGAFLFICQTLNISGTPFYSVSAGTGGAATGTGAAGIAGTAGNATPYVVLVP